MCVSNKLEGKYQDSVRNFLVKFDSWRAEVTRSYSRGPNSVRKAIHSVLRSAYANRWNRNLAKAVEELSRGACNFDSLNRFISAIRLEGDFVVEDTSGASGMSKGSGEGETSSSIGGGGISDRSGPMGGILPRNFPHGTASSGNNRGTANDISKEQESRQLQPRQGKRNSRGQGLSPKTTLWVMTMHSAKGLEFDEVFLPFWTDSNIREEDRRLAFVSLTRARESVRISYAINKSINPERTPSRGSSRARTFSSSSSQLLAQKPSMLCLELQSYDKLNAARMKTPGAEKVSRAVTVEDYSVGQN